MKKHHWSDLFDVDIMDAEGPEDVYKRQALTMMTAMSYSPVKMAAPMPMTYIQQDTAP